MAIVRTIRWGNVALATLATLEILGGMFLFLIGISAGNQLDGFTAGLLAACGASVMIAAFCGAALCGLMEWGAFRGYVRIPR